MVNDLKSSINDINTPQCQFFVMRKKRLCRMTVRPGRNYCGEHEPQPKPDGNQIDLRIPCPYDSKHTCYASKLEKHLSICNGRQHDVPPYIVHNVNCPPDDGGCPRRPLSAIPKDFLVNVVHKVNQLYEKLVEEHISHVAEHPIHAAVVEEFAACGRAESSRRHLRQASSLLHVAQRAGLVRDHTCYLELGAGKGQLSYYACRAWCAPEGRGSRVLLVERASLRHKRDNRLRAEGAGAGACVRLRADLAHLALAAVPAVDECAALVGLAKHLCGVAMDYALRCVVESRVASKTRGLVLATCCHHRCERAAYVATAHLQELGINGEELNVMLGLVSWATCGDGRSRDRRSKNPQDEENPTESTPNENSSLSDSRDQHDHHNGVLEKDKRRKETSIENEIGHISGSKDQYYSEDVISTQARRERVGRRAKALLDWGRVLYLREKGFEANLCYYVPTTVSLENMCIVAKNKNNI